MTQSAADELSARRIREELSALLSSPTFARAETQRRLLRHIVESTLAGDFDRLKEYTIAVDLLGRPPSFDPRMDPVVRVEVRRLRARLDDHYAGSASQVRIEIPKGGYRAVFVLADPAPEASAAPKRRWLVVTVASTLLIAGAAWGAWHTMRISPLASPAPVSIAILPFVNFTGDSRRDFFSDGLTEELIGELARIPELRVVARTSAFQFRNAPGDIREIAKRLQVGFVLEGSVRESGGKYRISAQLINAASGYHVWSNTFDYRGADAVRVQQDIARTVAASVAPALGRLPPARRSRTVNTRAWEDYLQGRYLWNKREQKSVVQSIDFFRSALAQDPAFSDAYAGLADAHLILWSYTWVLPNEEAAGLAKKYADKAVELDPSNVDALTTRALLAAEYDLDWAVAENKFLSAISMEPAFAKAHQWFALVLAARGRFPEAFSQIDLAEHLDPIAVPAYDTAASIALYARRTDPARAAIQKIEALAPGFPRLGVLRGSMALIEQRGRGYVLPSDRRLSLEKEASRLVAAREAHSEVVSPLDIAYCFNAAGDAGQTLHWIETSIAEHDAGALWLAVDWNLYNVRGDPRFRQILHRHNLDEALTKQ